MRFHPTESKVGKSVENAVVKDVVSRMKRGRMSKTILQRMNSRAK